MVKKRLPVTAPRNRYWGNESLMFLPQITETYEMGKICRQNGLKAQEHLRVSTLTVYVHVG